MDQCDAVTLCLSLRFTGGESAEHHTTLQRTGQCPVPVAMASNTIRSVLYRAVLPLNTLDVTQKMYPMVGCAWIAGTLCASQDLLSAWELVCVLSCWCWHPLSSPRGFKSPVLHRGAWALAPPGSKAGGAEQPTPTMLVRRLGQALSS